MTVLPESTSDEVSTEPAIVISAPDTEAGPAIHYERAEDIQDQLEDCVAITIGETGGSDVQDDDGDVYRGEPSQAAMSLPQPSPLPRQTILTFETRSVASSDSSSSINVGRRFGAIAVAVENAITRWAKSKSSGSSTTSSSSSSSSSSGSSHRTHATSKKRRRQYSGVASVHNAARERELQERKRMYAETRVIPRDFTLFLPPELANPHHRTSESTSKAGPSSETDRSKRVIQTTSLPEILTKLDAALKQSTRTRKARLKEISGHIPAEALRKGKTRAQDPQAGLGSGTQTPTSSSGERQRGWWLDVASPTWSDMRSIGKLLHLHPLTLEDILHRDPREKLELFPGLGYYLIIFRALEGAKSRERFRKATMQLDQSSGDEGLIGAVNVYLVVFREGILSFHFEDISEHTERLLNKILKLENIYRMTSDWIAHGLLDSIVDAFFPVLTSIEKEVKEIDALVLRSKNTVSVTEDVAGRMSDTLESVEKPSSDASNEKTLVNDSGFGISEKYPIDFKPGKKVKSYQEFFWPFSTVWMQGQEFFRLIHRKRKAKQDALKYEQEANSMYTTGKTLLRMSATRRIVTSLGRLLGTKGEVIAQIRKRLRVAAMNPHEHGASLEMQDDGEIAIYMGDIQDHIYTILQSLHHYERMLSSSHPAYLAQLRVSQSNAKGGTDRAILTLTVVSMTVLSIQLVLGLFGMNVNKIPTNNHAGGPFNVFYIILGFTILVGCGVVSLVRYWLSHAKRKYTRMRKI